VVTSLFSPIFHAITQAICLTHSPALEKGRGHRGSRKKEEKKEKNEKILEGKRGIELKPKVSPRFSEKWVRSQLSYHGKFDS